ncbi:MAG TPA: coproporphyrinogen-III oxidase family protein [Gemmataceae bacterium]|jgi:oxygen-independent coproporphyrinogen-3 oxidase
MPTAPPVAPPWVAPRAAYVHVPFCAHHCGYCDFAVATGADDRIDAYVAAVERELELLLGEPRAVETIFVGGGTPTYLTAGQLDRLLSVINHWLPLQAHPRRRVGEITHPPPRVGFEGVEFSIESTPDSLTADKVAVLADHGVTRVSVGVQSFDPRALAVLERVHAPADVPRAVDCVRRRVDNVSLDLIFGVPGQSLADWDADLKRALELNPDHISTYGLTYETGTRLWKQRRRGLVTALDEDAELALYLHALDTLAAAGYRRYEVSNHARPGRDCRHNQTYWANWAYFGFGVGAARYVGGTRELNTRSLPTYLDRIAAGRPAAFQSETLGPGERARETISTQLRRAEGISRDQFREQTGYDLDALAGPKVRRHVATGLLADDGRSVALTRAGVCVADSLIADLM